MLALADVLLVLLGDRPGTAHEIQCRHADTFGPHERVDISRVTWTLGRQERLGLVRSRATPAQPRRRSWALTDAGARRQRMWLLRVPAEFTPDDVRIRVLLAVAATDRATFDMVVQVCLAQLELSRLRAAPAPASADLSPASARAELTDAALAAEVAWLRSLHTRRRARDRG
ncbi:hypothetical protein [Paractinoplanes ferrugineus]|uniref:hypothetical protein n=1 Tax=Paractinoplanes ferrugineus TaxID=113564 RepID=UPI001941EE44|nr:hypothetical protein [Actinoplanes ferrugineus]